MTSLPQLFTARSIVSFVISGRHSSLFTTSEFRMVLIASSRNRFWSSVFSRCRNPSIAGRIALAVQTFSNCFASGGRVDTPAPNEYS